MIRSEIEAAVEAYGEDALGPLFTSPLVIETDIERAEREEREYEARAYQDWVESYMSWESDWWEAHEQEPANDHE